MGGTLVIRKSGLGGNLIRSKQLGVLGIKHESGLGRLTLKHLQLSFVSLSTLPVLPGQKGFRGLESSS